jgi:hypothetical protein
MIVRVIEEEVAIMEVDYVRQFFSEANDERKVLFGADEEWSESFTPSDVEESECDQFMVQVYQSGTQMEEFYITEDEVRRLDSVGPS